MKKKTEMDPDKKVRALVNWKTKRVIRWEKPERPPMGFESYGLEEGWNRKGPATEKYVSRLLGHIGVNEDLIPHWKDDLTYTWETTRDPFILTRDGGFKVPIATLFLGIRRNFIPDDEMNFYTMREVDGTRDSVAVKALVEADPEMEALAERVRQETGALRIWVHLHYRIFKGGEIPDSGAPWVKMMTRPVNVVTSKYHVGAAPLDAVDNQ